MNDTFNLSKYSAASSAGNSGQANHHRSRQAPAADNFAYICDPNGRSCYAAIDQPCCVAMGEVRCGDRCRFYELIQKRQIVAKHLPALRIQYEIAIDMTRGSGNYDVELPHGLLHRTAWLGHAIA
jgi:hypothetical protein